jgi:hypothetical protein
MFHHLVLHLIKVSLQRVACISLLTLDLVVAPEGGELGLAVQELVLCLCVCVCVCVCVYMCA